MKKVLFLLAALTLPCQGQQFTVIPPPGKSVMNMGALADAYPFINLFKSCRSLKSSGTAFPAILDVNGYPQSTPTQDIICSFDFPQNTNAFNWVMGWTGTATISISTLGVTNISVVTSGSCTNIPGTSLSVTGTNCRAVFSFAAAPPQLQVTFLHTATYSNWGNAYLVRSDRESLYLSGEAFNPDFTAALKGDLSLNPRILRFIDWADTNSSNLSTFSYGHQAAAFGYGNEAWAPGAWGGTISGSLTGGVDVYVGAAAPDTPLTYTDGEQYQGFITFASTGDPATLNVGGRGAKPIIRISGGSPLAANEIPLNSTGSFEYSLLLDSWLYTNNGFLSGVPLSMQVALCNELNTDCWFNIPNLFTDASITAFATYVRDNLKLSLTAHFEYSNEVWNSGFAQSTLATAQGTALGFPGFVRQQYGWYALRTRQMQGLVTAAWAPRSLSTLKRVMAFQAFAGDGGVLANTYRFQGADLSTALGYSVYNSYVGVSYNTAPNRPIDYSDELSYATYFQGGEIQDVDLDWNNPLTDALTAADNYASGDPTRMALGLAFVDSDIRSGGCTSSSCHTLSNLVTAVYSVWQSLNTAQGYNLPIVAYEGGYQGQALSASRAGPMGLGLSSATCGTDGTCIHNEFVNLIAAYKNTVAFSTLVQDQYAQFLANSQAGSIPAWYDMIQSGSKWAIYPTDLYSAPFQSFNGIARFNSTLP